MKKTIGIIGGMGPAATVDLFSKIVSNTAANCDSEHIHILVDNNPMIPDRTSAIKNHGPSPVPFIVETGNRLADAGADFLVMPCNTSHAFYDDIVNQINVPLINMVKETVDYVKNCGIKKAGVLGTDGLMLSHVYDRLLKQEGIIPVLPSQTEQRIVMDLIYGGVKSGNSTYCTEEFEKVLANLYQAGAQTVILGCTELPIAVKEYGICCRFVDPTVVLARAAIVRAGFRCKQNEPEGPAVPLLSGRRH